MRKYFFVLWLYFIGTPVFANAGVPMLVVLWPPMIVLLLPVIWIEAVVIRRKLLSSARSAWYASALSNTLSTFIGIPAIWVILTAIEFLEGGRAHGQLNTIRGVFIAGVIQAPWIVPYEEAFYWLVPLSIATLTGFFFLTSWFSEAFIIWLFWKTNWYRTREALFWSNFYSYLFLGGALVVGLMITLFFGFIFAPLLGPLMHIIYDAISFIFM